MNEILQKITYTRRKKNSSKTNEFSFRKGPNSLGKKIAFSRSNVFSLGAMGFFSKNNHVSNRFVITTISVHFYISL